ncbi:hypothetical protein ACJD0Z_17190 [Flavobacteriaceae bacterium M23B6Z8]
MKQKKMKKLQLVKKSILKLNESKVQIIKGGATEVSCNSVPRHLGGIGCHLF